LLIHPMDHSVPVAEIKAVNANAPDSLLSMQSLISFDTENLAVISEAKNNRLLMDDSTKTPPSTPEPIEKINFILSGPVTVGEKPLSELTVQVEKPTDDEKEFDSMVSPTQVREHKKSIDEQFEKLLMDDNNNNPLNDAAADVFKPSIESTPPKIAPVKIEPAMEPVKAEPAITTTKTVNSS